MSEKRVLLDTAAFMDSAHALSITGAATSSIRTIVQRYLAACYDDTGKAPRLLDGDDMAQLLRESLPRHFGARDPLASCVHEVMAAYLTFLAETQVVMTVYEQRRALDEHSDAFCAVVKSGAAHKDGIAITSKGKTIVHRAKKTGRNEPCPCGSGLKFKKCCMPSLGP